MGLINYLSPDYFRAALQNSNDPLYKKEMEDFYRANWNKITIEEIQQHWIDEQVKTAEAEREQFLDQQMKIHRAEYEKLLLAATIQKTTEKSDEAASTEPLDIATLEERNEELKQEVEKKREQLAALVSIIQTADNNYLKWQEQQVDRIIDHFKEHKSIVIDGKGKVLNIELDAKKEQELRKLLAPTSINKLVIVNPTLIEKLDPADSNAIGKKGRAIENKGDVLQELKKVKFIANEKQRIEDPGGPEPTGAALLALIKLNKKSASPKQSLPKKEESAANVLTAIIETKPEREKLQQDISAKEQEIEKNQENIQNLKRSVSNRPTVDPKPK